jgi:GT2 family glycosyltransferase
MPTAPSATVVVIARDRWSQTPGTLDRLLARTDPSHPVVVVDGKAPRQVAAALDRLSASGRIRLARRGHHLAANEARNIGVEGARTEWIAFVENDALPSEGWLETLMAAGEAHDAASVYPAFLQPGEQGPTVHGLGADLEVGGPEGARYVREVQHHLNRPWSEVAGEVKPAARVQSEFHTLVVRRELLEQIGGLDEGLLSWFDHTDLALHHVRLGATAWFTPEVTCAYELPTSVSLTDLPGFLLRWSSDWYERSLDHLCRVWGLDRHHEEWASHARYRRYIRRGVPTPWRPVNAGIELAAVPMERLVGGRSSKPRRRDA